MTALTTTPDLFRAFADPTRLRLLNLLLEGECCVCVLCDVLKEFQPKVSRHLAYLRRVGLVHARRDGKWIHYRLTDDPAGIQQTLLACVRDCLRDIDTLQRDLATLREIQATSPRCS